jgi:hypothetical protein
MLETLKQQFAEPPAEFSPIPFWFWNDELSKAEISRQIHDFHAKEVNGFVIHPRMGLSTQTPYLSDAFMELVEVAVVEAAKLEMSVILYDEGMYPSGSACGLVVQQNPEFASRGLRMEEHSCGRSGLHLPLVCTPGEEIIAVQAVRKLSDRAIVPGSAVHLNSSQASIQFMPPDDGDWSVLLFIETDSKGKIRGVHFGQDDGEPDAPLAADLLNPDAVQAFISITHENYYKWLSPYFGSTIFAFFTDEPDLLGRGHTKGLKPWTRGFMAEFLSGNSELDLPALWFEAGEKTRAIRSAYETTVRNRLERTYYKQLADWCEDHGIGLTGHPAASDDIGLLAHFHIPGQDVVWRYIAPEDGKSLTGAHSTMGKCSSDAARHRDRRRNLNECFGVCGNESGWALSADNMKWYLDWLFVRGVNLISPHAFYYSIRDTRRDERPPDVGPNNIYWSEYSRFARYIKRMSWLMTDIVNLAEVAVLAQPDFLPWRIVKPLYEYQTEFNYLEEELLGSSCQIESGIIRIANQQYKALLIEDGARVKEESRTILASFIQQGGVVIEMLGENRETIDFGQVRVKEDGELLGALRLTLLREALIQPPCASIRVSQVAKEGIIFYVIVNEGEDSYQGKLVTELFGRAELWQPWSGAMDVVHTEQMADGHRSIGFTIERRECLVIAIDPHQEHVQPKPARQQLTEVFDLSDGWQVQGERFEGELTSLHSWTEWEGMQHFSGTSAYEKNIEYTDPDRLQTVTLDLGEAHEFVQVWVNGQKADVRMWKPYSFQIEQDLKAGMNVLRVEVTNSLANRYDGLSLPSGLIGPVRIQTSRHILAE